LFGACLAILAFLFGPTCAPPSNVVWQRRYDSGQEDYGRAVVVDGRSAIVGGTWRDTTGEDVLVDWQILRYDEHGTLTWRRVFDSGERDWLSDVAVDSNHNVVALGFSSSRDPDTVRLLLVKFSQSGSVVWDRQLALGLATTGMALATGPAGRILVCGTVFAGGDSADDDVLLAEFDSDGVLLRWVGLDFGADENGLDAALNQKGGVTLVCSQQPLDEDSTSTADLLVVRTDADLRPGWRRVYDSGEDDLTGSLASDSLGNCYVAVTYRGDVESDVRLLEYSVEGELLMDKAYVGRVNAVATALALDRGGTLFGVGAAGPEERQTYMGFSYRRRSFSSILDPTSYTRGANDLANDVGLDSDDNILITGVSDPGIEPDILTVKLLNRDDGD
jgi:hypothetical protein